MHVFKKVKVYSRDANWESALNDYDMCSSIATGTTCAAVPLKLFKEYLFSSFSAEPL